MAKQGHLVVSIGVSGRHLDTEIEPKQLAMVCRGCGGEIDVQHGLSGDDIQSLLQQHIASSPLLHTQIVRLGE